MKVLPSEEKKEKEYIRLAADTFERVETGDQRYLILQGKYKTGDSITLLEFKGGIGTGRRMQAYITHMDDDATSTAITEGYNVLSIKNSEEGRRPGSSDNGQQHREVKNEETMQNQESEQNGQAEQNKGDGREKADSGSS